MRAFFDRRRSDKADRERDLGTDFTTNRYKAARDRVVLWPSSSEERADVGICWEPEGLYAASTDDEGDV